MELADVRLQLPQGRDLLFEGRRHVHLECGTAAEGIHQTANPTVLRAVLRRPWPAQRLPTLEVTTTTLLHRGFGERVKGSLSEARSLHHDGRRVPVSHALAMIEVPQVSKVVGE